MLCPLVPCSSRAKETTVLSPVSNGQPILFLLGISLLWLQLYMYVTWSSCSLIIFGWLYTDIFFVWSICGFCTCLPICGLIYAICVFLLLLELCSRSLCKFCLLSFGSWHPFSLCFGWYSISKSAWYVISCVILGTLSISSVCCVLFIVLVWCHPVVYFWLMGCFCLHRAFLVTHVQGLTEKKIHHHIIFYHCG